MKSLLALLLIGLGLGFGYWKIEHPDTTVDDLTANASNGVQQLKGGFSSVFNGGESRNALNSRLDSIEAELAQTQQLADPKITTSRLDSLEAAIIATQQSSDQSVINGRLTDAERRMSAAEAKQATFLSQISSSVESINSDSDKTTEQLAMLSDRIDLLNRRIEEQSEQINISDISEGITSLEADTATLRDDQRRTTSAQSVSLSNMEEKLNSLEARLDTLSADAGNDNDGSIGNINAQIDQRIATLENKLNTTNADSLRIESMANELSASRVRLQAMEQSANDTNAQLAAVTEQLSELKTQSESSSIDGQQLRLQSQLQQLQDEMNKSDSNADVTELANALQATRGRIENLEQRVIELPPSSSVTDEVTQTQSSLQAQIQELEKKLTKVEAAPDPALVDSISQVEEKVSELAAKGYVTQEELRQQQQGETIEYKIYFERNSTEISEDAGAVLNSFIAQEKNRTTGVSIYGFTDRRGPAAYNQELALQRATNVRSYLIQNGFSYVKIRSVSGLGEDAAANRPDGEEDAQQRAVVIYAQQP